MMSGSSNAISGLALMFALVVVASGCSNQANSGSGAPGASSPATVAVNNLPVTPLDPKSLEQMSNYEKKILALGGRPRLHLDLSGSKITDDDLANLEVIAMVTSMDLSYTNITDKGIEHLKKYPQLEQLTIVSAPITDTSIEYFKEMPKLWKVDLDGTKVSQAGGMQLIKLLGPRANEHIYRPKPGRPMRN